MSFLYVLYALYGSKKTFMSFFYVLYVKKKLYVLLLCPVHLIWFKKKLIYPPLWFNTYTVSTHLKGCDCAGTMILSEILYIRSGRRIR